MGINQHKTNYLCSYCKQKKHGKRRVKTDSNIKLVKGTTGGLGRICLPICLVGKRIEIRVLEKGR